MAANPNRYKIILAGSHGGTLECYEVATEAEIGPAIQELVINSTIAAGDTIKVIDTMED